jgi:ribosomal protein S18 acetylase RimI-like enzyme
MTELRRAGAADVAAVSRITSAAYAVYEPRIGRSPAPVEADHAALVAAGEVWLAELDGAPAGVLVVRPHGRALLLESVAVDPGHQGRGIGRALIEHAEQLAAREGLEAVELYTNAAMTENLTLYPRLGYRETGRGVEDGYDRVYFRKAVAAAGR